MIDTEQDPGDENTLAEPTPTPSPEGEGDRPIIVQGAAAPEDETSEGDRPIIVQGGGD